MVDTRVLNLTLLWMSRTQSIRPSRRVGNQSTRSWSELPMRSTPPISVYQRVPSMCKIPTIATNADHSNRIAEVAEQAKDAATEQLAVALAPAQELIPDELAVQVKHARHHLTQYVQDSKLRIEDHVRLLQAVSLVQFFLYGALTIASIQTRTSGRYSLSHRSIIRTLQRRPILQPYLLFPTTRR